jgi:hypothetical protein
MRIELRSLPRATRHLKRTGAGRGKDGYHDVLVFAVMLACWLATSVEQPYTGPVVYNSHNSPLPMPSGLTEFQQCAIRDLGIDFDGDWEDPSSRNPWKPW